MTDRGGIRFRLRSLAGFASIAEICVKCQRNFHMLKEWFNLAWLMRICTLSTSCAILKARLVGPD